MKTKIIIASLILPLNLFGQLTDFHGALNELANGRQYSNLLHKKDGNLDLYDFTGSPYLSDLFIPAKISNSSTTFLLRYNIYNDEIILKEDEDKYYRIPKDNNFKFISFENREKVVLLNDTYYILLDGEPGKSSLVKKMSVKYYPPKRSENGYDPDKKANFSKQKDQYFYSNENTLIPLDKRLEDYLKLFPEKKEPVKSFLKQNSLREDKDYKNLFNTVLSN